MAARHRWQPCADRAARDPPRPILPPTPLSVPVGPQALRQARPTKSRTSIRGRARRSRRHLETRSHVRGRGRVKMNRRGPTTISAASPPSADDGSLWCLSGERLLARWVSTTSTIPGTLKADPSIAREMFRYAASISRIGGSVLYPVGSFSSAGAPRRHSGRALAATVGEQGRSSCAGVARRHAVQWRAGFAPGVAPGCWLIVAKDAADRTRAGSPTCTAALAQASEVSEH